MPQQIMRKEGRLGSYFPPVNFLTYGLGWFISDFNGLKMVEHGGNIDGMHAQVSLVPELELGMIFLSNSRNLMLEASRYHIVEIFANDEIALEPVVPACVEVVTVAKFASAAGDALNVGATE